MGIDQDQRRQDIARITVDLIAQEGLEAATIRRIAAEGGFSTTAITHYFVDKQDLLVSTFQILAAEGERRFDEVLQHDPSDLIGALITMVPWCPANVRRWKGYLAFWDGAARNPELASLIADSTNVGTAYMQRLIQLAVPGQRDLSQASQLLNALIQGLALQMLVNPQNWSEEKVRTTLEEAFALAVLKAKTTA